MNALAPYAAKYRRHLLESVVPFWLNHSLDGEYGGYFTCLDREGRVYDTRKYVWLQGRAAWMFSKLFNEVEQRPEWLAAARSIIGFVGRNGRDQDGRYFFSLTREGRPSAFQRKPYAAVFVVLGLLEYAKAEGGPDYQREAEDLFERIREWIARPELLGRPALAGQPPVSQMADVMVVSSMALELYAATGNGYYKDVMQECIRMAMRHYDPARRVLIENVSPEGARLDSPEGRLVCPGHSCEVSWFLLRMLEHHPDAEIERTVLDAIEGALEFGWDSEHEGLYYFMDIEGRPPMPLEWQMKLWWPHTEAIYALVLAYLRTKEDRFLRWLERVDSYSFRRFADPEFGEWFGYCDREGRVTHNAKGNSYKGFFHVPRFLLLSAQAIERSGADHPPDRK